jgi:hypothetical protein
MSVGTGRQNIIILSFLVIHKWVPDIYIGFSQAFHLQCIYKEIQKIEQLQSHEEGLSNIWGNAQIVNHIWRGRWSYMSLRLLHSEFPYICGKFDFLFYQCTHGRKRIWKACFFLQVGDGVASQKLLCTTAQDGKSSLGFTENIREYWMNYRCPGFLSIVWFGSSPTILPNPLSCQ